jgi:hypothetical protein
MTLRNAYLQKYMDASSLGGKAEKKKHKKSKNKKHSCSNVVFVDNDVVAPSRATTTRHLDRFEDAMGAEDGDSGSKLFWICPFHVNAV